MSDPSTNGAAALAIETRALTRRFGAFEAVRGLDLQVPARSVFGLVGPNGAGKTTTLSMLCGFLHPSSGEVRVLGHPAHDRKALAGRLSALPQDAPLPHGMTALQALRYWAELGGTPPARSREEAQAALDLVGLGRDGHRRCQQLSHGMGKRVALAQAFLGEPEVVLLDEPAAGLDPRSAHEVKEIIRARRGRATIVLSSHNLAEIEELCDAVAILDRGRIAQQGPLGEVTGRGELVRISLADESADAALKACQALPFVASAFFAPTERILEVRTSGAPPEQAVPALLRAVLDAGGRPVAVARGQRLEERVLALT